MIVHDQLVTSLRDIAWDDIREVSNAAPLLLASLAADPDWIASALERTTSTPALRDMCEELAELDKIVLLNDPQSGARIRMHVFRQGYFDRPHNHRFNFATHLLRGEYVHTIYDREPSEGELQAFEPYARLVRRERAGDGYAIEHTLIHSVAAEAATVTLTVRGPAQKARMLVFDDEVGMFAVYGVEKEDPSEVQNRRLSDERLADIRAMLVREGLSSPSMGAR